MFCFITKLPNQTTLSEFFIKFNGNAGLLCIIGNGWQYGKWRLAEYVPIHRDKNPMRATVPEFTAFPAIGYIACWRFVGFTHTLLQNPTYIPCLEDKHLQLYQHHNPIHGFH